MAKKLFSESVTVFTYGEQREVALCGTDVNEDFSLVANGRVVFSETTGRVFFMDTAGQLWIVTTNHFSEREGTFESYLRPAERRDPQIAAENRIFSPSQAAELIQ